MVLAYGGYNLQLGDSDQKRVYEGQERSEPTEQGYVRQLQEDLEKLGFNFFNPSPKSGEFDLKTEWAVREFQIYAKMPFVAKVKTNPPTTNRYVDTLEQTQNTKQYKGSISGVANPVTRELIQHWLANNWRCPVVVEVWVKTNRAVTQPEDVAQNLWLPEQFRDKKARIFVRDFSEYYIAANTEREDYRRYDTFSQNRPRDDRDKLIVLGTALNGGPISNVPNNVWYPETEVLPENLVGKPLGGLTAEELSTYKVARTVAEQECLGFFDSINAYDDAVLSLGPCHWTLLGGELGAFFAYLKSKDLLAFQKAIEFFGVQPDKNWSGGTGTANGDSLFNRSIRTYAAFPSQQTEAGSYKTIAKYKENRQFNNEETKKYANYFKTWHWFYRFVMASRTIEGFRRSMWDMARIRLRDILFTPWPKETAPNGGGGDRRTTIGDIYTSEKAVALLLRYHIWRPASVIKGGVVSNLAASKSNPPNLQQAYQKAVELAEGASPTQQQLVDGIFQVVTAWVGNKPSNLDSNEGKAWNTRNGFLNTLKEVRDWPTWRNNNPRKYQLPINEGLSIEPNSFKFEPSGLLGTTLPNTSKPYGGYNLQQGDFDNNPSNPAEKFKYDGSLRPVNPNDPLPVNAEQGFVRELQEDLKKLGFLIIKTPSGVFDEKTKQALREFQRYAKMEYVAQELSTFPSGTKYVDRLLQIKNPLLYQGEINGEVNEETRALIKEWLIPTSNLRCPVVIYRNNSTTENLQPEQENIWLYSDVQTEATKIFVKDFSQYYADGLPPSRSDGLFELGHYYAPGDFLFNASLDLQADLNSSPNLSAAWRSEFTQASPPITLSDTVTVESDRPQVTWIVKDVDNNKEYTIRRTDTALNVLTRLPGGPRTLNLSPDAFEEYRNCWQEAEILPTNLIGKAPSELSNAESSTFLVIRAIAEAASQNESFGFLDSLRAYDRTIPAFGLFDARNNSDGKELFAHLSYLQSTNPVAFTKAFEFFGISADKDWADNKGEKNGVVLYGKNQRDYTASPVLEAPIDIDEAATEITESTNEDFATWHWFYRFVMANRTVAGHRQAIWDITRIRLRSLLTTPFPKGFLPDVGTRRALINDVYTSEQSVAILTYWYLRFPQDIVDNGLVGEVLRNVCNRAVTNNSSPTDWTDSDEQNLIRELIAEGSQRYSSEFGQVLENLRQWPLWASGSNPHSYQLAAADVFAQPLGRSLALISGRRSFQFDTSRLTPPIPKSVTATKRAIRLSAAPVSGNQNQFSVLALAEEDEDAPGIEDDIYKITAVILTLENQNQDGDRIENGIRLPIIGDPIDFQIKLNPTSSGTTEVLNAPSSEPEPFDIYDISDDAELPQETSWKLDISSFQDAVASVLQIDTQLDLKLERTDDSLIRQVYLRTEITAPFFRNSLKWLFAAAGSPESNNVDFFEFREFGRESSLELKFNLSSLLQVLQNALPISFTTNIPAISAHLTLELIDETFRWRLETEVADKIAIDLGSSLARLELESPKLTLDAFDGLLLSFPQAGATAALFLDIFAWAREDQKIINNIWANNAIPKPEDKDFESFNWLLKLESKAGALDNLSSISEAFIWTTGIYPTIHKDLLAALTQTTVNVKRKLQSFAGDVLGAVLPYQLTFQRSAEQLELLPSGDYWRLLVPLILQVNGVVNSNRETIFEAKGKFAFSVNVSAQDPENYLDIQAGSFMADDTVEIEVVQDNISTFADLVSLYIPGKTIFQFYTDPRNPKIEWLKEKSQQKTPNKIALRIPGSKSKDFSKPEDGRFTFEMDKFSLGTDGFDLKGAVRVESILLGDKNLTGFQKPLAVKGVEPTKEKSKQPKIGEIEFKQSKLVYGSLQAVAQLNYFDDAIATFSLAIAQDKESLAVAGTVDITGLAEFHVDALFATFQIDLLHLGTKYTKKEGEWRWESQGAMSGRVKFQPAKGKSADEMGEIAELFKGVTVEFESLNPVKMGFEELKIQFPAKQFAFGKIFKVDLRGIKIAGAGSKSKQFELLGDIAIENLPGVDAQLSFGGITLIEVEGKNLPEFDVNKIGAGFSVAGGFEINGVLVRIKNQDEFGFGGAVTIKTEAIPQLTGLVKLTRGRTQSGELVPTVAIYFEAPIEASLFAGFFLRGLGLGLGINQALDGLENKQKALPLPQRITAFVDNPRGLPDPRLLESWIVNPPAKASDAINWMLVGKGVISYGNLPRNTEHSLVGNILLAIDQDLDIVAGVNLWLFCSPDQTERTDFIRNPAARGAIAISPRSQQVYGLFRTIKNPKFSDNAPKLLAEVLNKISTSLMFLCDRNGFLMEVGWPWETKIAYNYGSILKGTLTSGYRFGIYRGLISFGLNFGINVVLDAKAEIGFSTRFGKAGASLSVYGQGYFRCSFIGIITRDKPYSYLFGDVRVAATVEVRAEAYCKFSKKICGVKISLKISFKASLKISISASLVAAMEGSDIAFKGDANVAISVAGYSLSGSVPFQYKPDNIGKVKQTIDRKLPKFPAASQSANFVSPRRELASQSTLSTSASEPAVNELATSVFPGLELASLSTSSASVSEPAVNELATSVSPELEVGSPSTLSTSALEAVTPQIWNYRICRLNNQIRVLLFPKAEDSQSGQEYPRIEKLFDIFDDSNNTIKQALDSDSNEIEPVRSKFNEFANEQKSEEYRLSNNSIIEKSSNNKWRITDNEKQKYYNIYQNTLNINLYHIYQVDNNSPHFQIKLQQQNQGLFQGFLGSNHKFNRNSELLEWEESLEQVVITRDDVLNNRDKQDASVDGDLENVRDVTVGDLLSALTQPVDNQVEPLTTQESPKEIVDPRTQNPVAANADDETAGIAPEGVYSPYFKADNNEDSYDRKLADACKPYDPDKASSSFNDNNEDKNEGLSPGLLMSELVALVKDTQAQVNQPINSYTLAPYLNLVLVFDTNEELNKLSQENQLVPLLLDLESFKINGHETTLESVVGNKKPEYDLIAGSHFQSKSQICLTWDFQREDEEESITDIRTVYEELDRFVVTRTVLQKPNQTKILDTAPVWLRTTKGELLRSQFQFVDDLLAEEGNSIAEGDLVQYKVVAQTLDNRKLASCIINVIRQTIEPLEAPNQSLALHKLKNAKDNTYAPGDFEIAVKFTDLEADDVATIRDELRLRYRFVPASTVGIYGFEQTPDVKTKSVAKQVGQQENKEDKDKLTISFAESEGENSISWNEVQELKFDESITWKQLSLDPPQQEESNTEGLQLGYHLVFDEKKLWDEVRDIPAGMAIEFYAGREQYEQSDSEKRIKARSRLFRCRHAILLPSLQASEPQQTVAQPNTNITSSYFSRGNTVNAIEKLPLNLAEIAYLQPQFIQVQANYALKTVQLLLTWRHDSSCRGETNRPCQLPGTLFNPVVSYRIHRCDEYSPIDYIRYPDEAKILAKPELTVRVLPKLMYQSMPSTIEVQGREVEKDKIITDWQAKLIEPEALWKLPDRTQVDENPLTPVTSELNPVWLLKPIYDLLENIKVILDEKNQGHRYVLKFHYPLEDKSSEVILQDGATLQERIEKLVKTLDKKTDPFGWWGLEALGLSCECYFEDLEGKPVDAKYITEIVRSKLHDTVKDYPVSIALFLAEDNKTFLYTLRIVYVDLLRIWSREEGDTTLPYLYLKNPLGLRLKGRRDGENYQPLEQSDAISKEQLEDWLKNIQGWLENIHSRLKQSISTKDGQLFPGSVVIYKYNPISTDSSNNLQPAQITLPIDSEGLINCKLPVPDLWAHQYAIAIEIIRRYDKLWSRLQPSQQSTILQKIPYSALKHAFVERTLHLVPHNIIATPLPGSIQSLVFAHPAAFAATASAVNAVYGQYSGQTVFLQRRINPEERKKIEQLYQNPDVFPNEIDWQLYQQWLEDNDFEQVKPGPPVLRDEKGEWKTLALKPVEGTQAGIYGADRYVFPDLPAYYEYRVGVYSTAGRICSDVSTTDFISPLYDKIRQRPQTIPPKDVIFNADEQSLTLKLRLIHPRYHMLDEIRSLWVEAEEMFPVRVNQSIRYGSLPDVYLKYQLYIQENPGEASEPVLLPLAEILPPLTKGDNQPELVWKSKVQLTGALFNDGSELLKLKVLQVPASNTLNNLQPGELYLTFTLKLSDPRCGKILSVLQQSSNDAISIRKLIYLSVVRDGVWSRIV